MIGNIRKYPKIILGIFSFCCLMFVAGEFFIRYFFTRVPSVGLKLPDIVNILDKKLTFDDYQKRILDWTERYGYYYERYQLDRNSKFFRSIANNSVLNDFVTDVIFFKLADNLDISVGPEERNDILFGQNIDNSIKNSFVDKNGRFDRVSYSNFLKEQRVNRRLRNYWSKEVNILLKNKRKNKLKAIFDNMSFVNLLEIKRKFCDQNSSYNVEAIFHDGDLEDVDYSSFENEVVDYYNKNKDLFKCKEAFRIKYFINKFEIGNDVKNYNLNILNSLIDKFSVSSNPVEMSKARSDNDTRLGANDYSKSFYQNKLPSCFNPNDIELGSVAVEFPTDVSGLIKIYRVIDISKHSKSFKYTMAVLYKKVVVDECYKKALLNGIEAELKNVNGLVEFEEFAKEKGYKLEDLNVDLGTSDIKNFENINILKKELYKTDMKGNRFLPVILNKNGIFVGYLYDHLGKDSFKTLEEVKKDIIRKVKKKIMKDKVKDKIDSNILYKKNINELKSTSGFASFLVEDVNLSNIDKKKLKDKFLLRKLIKYSSLLDDFETSFFYFEGKIIKVRIKNTKLNDFSSDLFNSFADETRKKSNENDNYSTIFEKIYGANKLDYAYNLL